jgi:hypothetical protein
MDFEIFIDRMDDYFLCIFKKSKHGRRAFKMSTDIWAHISLFNMPILTGR